MPIPLPTIQNVYYGHTRMLYSGLPTGNIFTFQASGAPVTPDVDFNRAQTIADLLCTAWNSDMLPLYPTATTGTTSRVYPLGSPTTPAAVGSASGSGSNGTAVAPVSCAVIIRHAVLRRGKGSQSHSALSPLPASAITSDGKSVDPGAGLSLGTGFENFIAAVQAGFTAAFTGISLTYVQLSKKGTGSVHPILSSTFESLLGTERSRTPRP